MSDILKGSTMRGYAYCAGTWTRVVSRRGMALYERTSVSGFFRRSRYRTTLGWMLDKAHETGIGVQEHHLPKRVVRLSISKVWGLASSPLTLGEMPSLDTRAAKMQGDWLGQRRALRSPSWGPVSDGSGGSMLSWLPLPLSLGR